MSFVHGNYVFGVLKQNLPIDQPIIFGRTADNALDGKTGVVVGVGFKDAVCDHYIILLDEPYNGGKAIVITEACICPI